MFFIKMLLGMFSSIKKISAICLSLPLYHPCIYHPSLLQALPLSAREPLSVVSHFWNLEILRRGDQARYQMTKLTLEKGVLEMLKTK